MRVSIVTVSFNSEETIARTIESVLHQTRLPEQYYIIDGKSKDKTVDIAKSYTPLFQQRNVDYRVFSEPDKGIYDAMNKGIGKTDGDIVGLLNSDDWYSVDAVRVMEECFRRTGADVVFGDVRIVGDGKSFIKHAAPFKKASTRHWNHSATFVHRRVYDRQLYCIDTIYDDWDFILKCLREKKHFEVVHSVITNFSLGGVSSRKSIRGAFQRAKLKYEICRKNGFKSFTLYLDGLAIELAKYVFN